MTEYEPFDRRLAERLIKISAEIEAMNILLADKRRRAAAAAVQTWTGRYQEQSRAMEEALPASVPEDEQGQGERDALQMDLDDLGVPAERREEVARAWGEAVQSMQALGPALETTRETARRAENVVAALGNVDAAK